MTDLYKSRIADLKLFDLTVALQNLTAAQLSHKWLLELINRNSLTEYYYELPDYTLHKSLEGGVKLREAEATEADFFA
jgi:hypothetical protein